MNAIRHVPAWPLSTALTVAIVLNGCATTPFDPSDCPAGTQKLADCPPADAVQDPETARYYDRRSQDFAARAGFDPVAYARAVDIPVLHASAKFVGSTIEGALEAIASRTILAISRTGK